ncbi:hypothetical protein MTO96_050451 [Rhipicephalus appendiculatus]
MQTDVLVAIVVLIFTDVTIYTAGTNIRLFMNQFEPLWRYKTTHRGHHRCVVDRLVSVRPLSITFNRCLFLGESRCDLRILGVLDTQHRDRMTLFQRDTFRAVERVLFVAIDDSCAVFKVESLTHWHHEYYDLRVRNSSVHTGPILACKTYFKRVIGQQPSFYVYHPYCQRLIRQDN